MVNKMKKIILFLTCFLLFINVKAENKIYVFYGNECPVCKKLEQYLKTKKYEINYYETWNNEENNSLLEQIAIKFQDRNYGVPYIVIGNKRIIGFNQKTKDKIKYLVEKDSCDIVEDTINKTNKCNKGINLDNKIKVSFLGYIDSSKVLLGIIVIFIGITYGLNPNQIKQTKDNPKYLIMTIIINFLLLFILTKLTSLINSKIILITIIINSIFNIKIKKYQSKNKILNQVLNTIIIFISTLNISLIFSEIIKTINIKEQIIYISLFSLFQILPSIIIYIYTLLIPDVKTENKYYNIITKIITIIVSILLLIKISL